MAKMPFTAARVAAFKCPEGKQQAFLWDEVTPGLGLRATPHGKPAYVFQGLYCGRDVRITIGSPAAWSIKDAQAKARELQRLIDEGKDPRSLKRQAVAAQKEQEAEKVAQAVTVGDVWPEYLEEGKPKRRDAWKPRYLEDLRRMAAPGGEPKKRGTGKTRPGPLWPLLSLRLVDITEDTLKAWQDSEARNSKHQAARALMMFRGFLRWCATRPKYRALVDVDAGRAPALLQDLPSMKRRTDCLEAAQVAGWWTGVEQLSNRTASVYLRALLLPAIAAISRPATVITPRLPFQEGSRVQINLHGEERRAVLNRRQASTGSFSQFEYRSAEPVNTPSDKPVTAPVARPPAGEEDFDSLWKSL